MTIGIYAIRLKTTGEMYIQRSRDIERRIVVAQSLLNNGRHSNQKLQDAWNQHGSEAFEFLRLKVAQSEDELADLEKALLKKHRKKLFNVDRATAAKGKAGRKPGSRKSDSRDATWSFRTYPKQTQYLENYRQANEKDQELFDRLLKDFFGE